MIVIGVLGLPASGKSAVAETLQSLGAHWINADRIGHRVLQRGEIKEQLATRLGTAILRTDGEIDRPKLGEIVFGDDAASLAALKYLESLVHPPIRQQMTRQVAAALQTAAPAVVLDAPLLLEGHWDLWCDELWYVDTAEAIRTRAAAQRGWTPQTLQRRTAQQLPAEHKRRFATQTLTNSGTLEQLRLQVVQQWRRLVEREPRSGPAAHCRDHLLANL